MEKYKISYLSEECLYVEGSPILIETMAIVKNNQTGLKHVQLKFKNISNKRIALVKAKIFLYDVVGREVEVIEKQYCDLNAKRNESFASDVAIPIQEETSQKILVVVKEVCFHDGSVWICEQEQWEIVPKQKTLLNTLDDDSVVDELQYIYGKQMEYLPLKHKDLWFCSCGCANKEEHYCFSCDIEFFDIGEIDCRELRNDNIYRKAKELIQKDNSADIERGIELLKSISGDMDCVSSIGEARLRLEQVRTEEEQNEENKKKKKKKKRFIIMLSSIITAIVIIASVVIGGVVVSNKREPYEKLKEYATSNGKYDEDDDRFVCLFESIEPVYCFINYSLSSKAVELEIYYDDGYEWILTIEVDKNTILKQEYVWVYKDSYNNQMMGVVKAKEYTQDSVLVYTSTNAPYSARDAILKSVRVGITLYFGIYDYSLDIGVTTKDIGFDITTE